MTVIQASAAWTNSPPPIAAEQLAKAWRAERAGVLCLLRYWLISKAGSLEFDSPISASMRPQPIRRSVTEARLARFWKAERSDRLRA
jgi:hypothetical protein